MASYGRLERWLHNLALGIKPIAKISYELDQAFSRMKNDDIKNINHVFVCGLARSGSTILMRNLYLTEEFTSLIYRNMPFVLAPNIWKGAGLFQKGNIAPAERAHGDRIHISDKSPECFDEVFWQIFEDAGVPTLRQPENGLAQNYSSYIAAILNSGPSGRRYLSKNNNNTLRLPTLQKLFPQSTFIVLFRDPITQANSLLRQHKKFCALQDEEPFVRKYMDWLGHFEFGNGHRPLIFSKDGAENLAKHTIDKIDYWLEVWCQCYGWLTECESGPLIFISYESLCLDASCWKNLSNMCGCANDISPQEPFVLGQCKKINGVDDALQQKAYEIYRILLARFEKSFGAGLVS